MSLSRMLVLVFLGCCLVIPVRAASAKKDWKTLMTTVVNYAEEQNKDRPDEAVLGNHANLLMFQLEAFVAKHPDDGNAWLAKLLLPETKFNAARALHFPVDWRETEREIRGLRADQTLPARLRAEADYIHVSFLMARMRESDFTETDIQQAVVQMSAFLDRFPSHKAAPDIALTVGRFLATSDPEKAREVLKLAKRSPDPRIVNRADREFAVLPYRTQPLDWKFKSFGGDEVDMAQLRGKVVVIDFWATWCVPCIKDLPRLKAIYERFQSLGVEMIGISFDDSASDLRAGLAKYGMTWPQYFDGLGWGNKIGDKFAIKSIPTMWVVDKDGRVVTTEAWTGNLEYHLQRLLRK